MTEVWGFTGEPVSTGGTPGWTTLVEGSSFCISSASGDIEEGPATGLFARDTRLLSHWVLQVDGAHLVPTSR